MDSDPRGCEDCGEGGDHVTLKTFAIVIPEDHLLDVISIIRSGLAESGPWNSDESRQLVSTWCDELEAQLDLCHDDAASDEREP